WILKVSPKRVPQIQETAPRNGPHLSNRLDPRGHENEQRLLVGRIDDDRRARALGRELVFKRVETAREQAAAELLRRAPRHLDESVARLYLNRVDPLRPHRSEPSPALAYLDDVAAVPRWGRRPCPRCGSTSCAWKNRPPSPSLRPKSSDLDPAPFSPHKHIFGGRRPMPLLWQYFSQREATPERVGSG